MADEQKYVICRKVDEPTRVFGLTLDECIPVLGIIVVCLLFGNLLVGLVLAGASWLIIRTLKKGQGTSWLLNLMYWHLPSFVMKSFWLSHLPDSSVRHWLK